jgi:hypothetical protein
VSVGGDFDYSYGSGRGGSGGGEEGGKEEIGKEKVREVVCLFLC